MTTIRRTGAAVPPPSTTKAGASTPAAPAEKTSGAAPIRDSSEFASASPESVMKKFYAAFTSQKPAELEGLYAPDVKFEDAVFEYSDRAGTMKMWKTILANPKNTFRFEFDRTEGNVAYGRWVADYKIGSRPVHNEIETRIVIRDGKIVEHTDSFPWDKWVKQALPAGGIFANKIGQKIVTTILRAVVNR